MTAFSFKPPPIRPVTLDGDPRIAYAISQILGDYGDTVSVATKKKVLRKFGRSDDIDTGSFKTVWMNTTIAEETLPASDLIDTISSSAAGDTQAVTIEGHTISGSNLTFVVQSATLNGQTKVVLSTPLARSTRVYNNGATDFAGDVAVYEDTAIVAGVPTDKTKVHLTASIGKNQSEKCATSVSSVDYWILTSLHAGVLTKTAATVEFELQIKLSGKVFRNVYDFAASSSSGTITLSLDPYIIVPKNSDVRMLATSSANNAEVEAGMNGFLAVIV